MRTKFQWIGMSVFFLCCQSPLLAQDAVHHVQFDLSRLTIQEKEGQHHIDYPGAMAWGEPGSPQLPAVPFQWALPPGQSVKSIRINIVESKVLTGPYAPAPAQAPENYSKPQVSRIRSLGKAFLTADYPGAVAQLIGQNSLAGTPMATVLVYPTQYRPVNGELLFIRELEVVLECVPETPSAPTSLPGAAMKRLAEVQLGDFIGGIESNVSQPRLSSVLEAGEYPYVIITDESLVATFQPLADWKTQKGVPAQIVTTATIYQNYTGRDDQEKIRRFIQDAVATWGSEWILLGGDTEIIPDRKVWAMDIWDFGQATDDPNYNLPCDLYYADLDGDWNANGNTIWGEVDDDVNLIPEVFVGRAPVEDVAETQIFVEKVLAYEQAPDLDYLLHALFIGGILWRNPYTDGGVTKDYIDTETMPDRFDPITKVYTRDNDVWNPVIHDGAHLINHIDHAGSSGMGGYVYVDDVSNMPQSQRPGICFSIGCYPACIDRDCIAEQLINYEDGGLVAFIGNSRYGWGSPGNPNYGYSDLIDIAFFRALFGDGLTHLGQAVAAAKSRYAPFANAANVYRWCQFQVNLLGDPEMRVWTDRPTELVVDAPEGVPAGGGMVQIGVSRSGQPVQNARVCLMQEGGVYRTLLTEVDGFAGVQLDSIPSSAPITLTVTAENHLPYTASISVVHAEACLEARLGDDPAIEPRLRLDANQPVSLDLKLYNRGGSGSEGGTVTLRCADARITVLDSLVQTDGLTAGDSAFTAAAFRLQTSQDLPDRTVIPYEVTIQSGDQTWTRKGAFTAMRPVLSAAWRRSTDLGDGDGWFEPGETVEAVFCLKNSGLQDVAGVQWRLKQGDGLTGSAEWVDLPELLAGDTTQCSLVLSIPQGQSAPVQLQPQLEFGESTGVTALQTLAFPVGMMGLADDVETDAVAWTHEGNPDLWRVTTARQHSGRHAWRCTQEGEPMHPVNHPENTLTSPPFMLPPDADLSFWLWFEFPIFGSTGLYVEWNQGQGWETLDFIGAGGALAALPNSQIWTRYAYDLSDIAPGTEVRVRFRFVSDDEVPCEGFYLDDIRIAGPVNRPVLAPDVSALLPSIEPAVTAQKHSMVIDWSADANLAAIEQFDQDGYRFQGYQVYQLMEGGQVPDYGRAVAVFDLDDEVGTVCDRLRDPVTGVVTLPVRYAGTNAGLFYSCELGRDWVDDTYLIKGKRYTYGVAAYAVHPDTSVYPRCVEGPLQVVSAIFQEIYPGPAYGDTLAVEHQQGGADGQVHPQVVDPAQLTGHDYQLTFSLNEADTSITWSLKDMHRLITVIDKHPFVADEALDPVVDGMRLVLRQQEYTYMTKGVVSFDLQTHEGLTGSVGVRISRPAYFNDYEDRLTLDPIRLSQDYELRFTGVWETLDNGYTAVKEGTGSLVTLQSCQGGLNDHPLNPRRGGALSYKPFLIRVPFEIWNLDKNMQVTAIMQGLAPAGSMKTISDTYSELFHICDLPYTTVVLDYWNQPEVTEAITWDIYMREVNTYPGDKVTLDFPHMFLPGDQYLIHTEALDPDLRQPDDGGNPVNDFKLLQNYPNPFNQGTTLTLQGGEVCAGGVEITIYDLLGRKVRELNLPPNQRQVVWDGKDEAGHAVASGVYFYVVEAGKYKAAKKMLLIR